MQEIVGERVEQLLHADIGGRITDVFGVLDELHGIRFSVIRTSTGTRRDIFAVERLLWPAYLLVLRNEAALFAASDALVSMQTLEQELRRADHHFRLVFGLNAGAAQFFDQPLNVLETAEHIFRKSGSFLVRVEATDSLGHRTVGTQQVSVP